MRKDACATLTSCKKDQISGTSSGFPYSNTKRISRTTLKGPEEDDAEEEETFVEEEGSESTEAALNPVWESQGTGGPALAKCNQPISHQSEPSLLVIMQRMTQIMANLQASSSSEASKPPASKTPDFIDRTQPFKVRSVIHSCQLIFHNDKKSFFEDRKNNKEPAYLLNNWALSKSQLFALYGDANDLRKSEAELDSLRMK
ncbi:hypothetical protein O181_040526 [Austropuccinia psidii MF-1]|uniref:Uncharacterized protein n=1 Tax=Austropuccinia psidii MF-1 TaxID=1389203 RepID=A0A9Q3DHZ5_9BASI|nr:hypothetical protein [Austropuccinia psidii MF-1]